VPAPSLLNVTEPVGGTGVPTSTLVTVAVQVAWALTGIGSELQLTLVAVASGDVTGVIEIVPLTRV
jgi:hypothetical protein